MSEEFSLCECKTDWEAGLSLHNLRGILSISFKNFALISSNMSFLLISVLLPEPEPTAVSATTVETTAGAGAIVTVVAPVGSAATMASGFFLNKLNFIVTD